MIRYIELTKNKVLIPVYLDYVDILDNESLCSVCNSDSHDYIEAGLTVVDRIGLCYIKDKNDIDRVNRLMDKGKYELQVVR